MFPVVEPLFGSPELQEGSALVVDLDGVPVSPAAGHESDGLLALLRCGDCFMLVTHYEIWNLGCLDFLFQRCRRGIASELGMDFK